MTEQGARAVLDVARLVADHWRKAVLRDGDMVTSWSLAAHPLCCVLAALDGESHPEHLGVSEGPDADAIRRAASPPASPEGPDDGLRERLAKLLLEHLHPPRYRGGTWTFAAYDAADAVLPLLTAERERVAEQWMRTEADMAEDLAEADDNAAALRREIDALQRQVGAVRALCDKAEQQQPGRLPAVDVRDLRAALSRTATEGDDRD